ncbi:MAG TPA: peptidoglycan-associated lipoprotein Pal [Myxococcota bacterium]|jgi:peptidoglycan-associated lipoprotein
MTQAIRFFALAAMTAVFAAGCPGPDYPKCEKDDQCKKDAKGNAINQYCLFGQCQECAKDNNCAAGMKCQRGRCEKACASDDQCGTGQICEESACQPAQCTDAKPCGGGMQCDKGRCKAPSATNNTATNTTTAAGACVKTGRVSFDFNMADLRPDSRELLDSFAKCMATNSDWKLTIEGHCDERGTTDYNLALGERRANTVKEYLSKLGVDKARIRTISYGKEKPLDTANTEEAWAKNRRGELVVQ